MIVFSETNRCDTLITWAEFITLPCVPRPKAVAVYMPLDPDAALDRRHAWTDGNRGREGGRCLFCHRTLEQVRVRINPKTGEPVARRRITLAQAIALRHIDVPTIV